jgi:hypothetical protein
VHDIAVAWGKIMAGAGTDWDPRLVESFASAISPYGSGATVALSDRTHGVVIKTNAGRPDRPVVRITHDATGSALEHPSEVDMAASDSGLAITHATDHLPTDAQASTAARR